MTSQLLKAIPNALSLTRLALGLAFPGFPAAWRLGVVAVAGLTDLLDGVASRHWNAASVAGQLLDPLADKVFAAMVLVTLLIEGTLAPWQVLLVGSRDLTVLAGAGWFLIRGNWPAYRRMRPTLLGKAATAAQFFFFLSLLLPVQQVESVFLGTAALSGLAATDLARGFLFPMEPAGKNFPGSGCGDRRDRVPGGRC